MHGIVNLSVIPCRKEPSDKSEMVTQLLFGEHFEILEEKKSWVLIRTAYDSYECWIDSKQYLSLNTERGFGDASTAVSTDLLQLAEHESGSMIPVVLGSSLPNFKNGSLSLGKEKYSFEGSIGFPFAKTNKPGPAGIGEVARWYVNSPYLWGGRSPFGLDCSGFTQMVFKLNGIKLKRDAWQQAEQGNTISFLEEARASDLAFFDNEDGKIVHTGILLEAGNIIHASGKVRIDKLDHQGIYHAKLKKYTHRLRIVKRML